MDLKFFTITDLYQYWKENTLQFNCSKNLTWDVSLSSKFVYNLMKMSFIPNFYFLNTNGTYSVLDGYQRLMSIFAFFDGYLPNGDPFKLKLEDCNDELHNIKFDQLSLNYKNTLLEKELVVVMVSDLSEFETNKLKELL